MVCKIFDSGEFPEEWAVGIIVILFKGSEKNDLNNYRGITLLTLLIPSYFGPTLYTKGGSSRPPGHLDPLNISLTISCTNVKFCKVLEIPFKVSENTRFVKNLLYGYHGNCLITWYFSLIIVKMIMKNR